MKTWLTVREVRRLLAILPDDALVVANRVGNLSLYRRDVRDEDYLGFIDFADGTWNAR
jgi:hypothetical protein